VDQSGCDLSGSRAFLCRIGLLILIAIALLFAGAAARRTRPTSEAQSPGAQVPAPPAEAWVRTELFFGLTDRDGHPVSTRSWQHFVDIALVAAFPDGFTLVKAKGRWLDRTHATRKEPTEIFIVLYRASDATTMNRRIEQVSRDYVHQFHQESILRADSNETVRSYGP
jgi:Protein of unknown function (DUF3574)